MLHICVLVALTAAPTPPDARISPQVTVEHGIARVDPYAWMRDRDNSEVIEHLEAENAYAETVTAHLDPLREQLYNEFLGRLVEDDVTVPWVGEDGWTYWSQTKQGKDYPILLRKRGDLEQVVLDENELADEHDYFEVTNIAVSPSGELVAWLQDTSGAEHATLTIKNIATGEQIDESIDEVAAFDLAWIDDSNLYYLRYDHANRPNRVYRHIIGTPTSSDTLVAEESDERFWAGVSRLSDGAGVIIPLDSTLTTEVRFIASSDADAEPVSILPRTDGVEYEVDHQGDRFLVRINDAGDNFRLIEVPDSAIGKIGRELVPHDPNVYLTGIAAFQDSVVLSERRGGYTAIEFMDPLSLERRVLPLPEQVSTVRVSGENEVFEAPFVRMSYMSPVTPIQTVDIDIDDLEWHVRKQREVPGWDASKYAVTRVMIPARDGTMIPVSITHLAETPTDGSRPMLLYGYGAYGSSMDPYFSTTRPSLIDRGVVYAVAHVRGGGEMGRYWYDTGKFHDKINTFTDFIDVAEGLIEQGWADPDRIAIEGGSAGGLLIGAVLNMRPDLWRVANASVPFVDVVNTMLDPTIPLTVGEYEEWGNPMNAAFYKTMLSYSPYDNVVPKPYPAILVTAGLNDPRVQYWEPTKWVAKLRDHTTSNPAESPILQRTNMGAGHGGASGRYGRYREIAWEDAFLLDQLRLH
ncbi:MAG: S9 family peptidase [Phycisphaerales bacterium]|nr:S9 family peptidase [Phycisphaerales bacterium]MDP6311387.1 S9 family peptidase [Phycisphaerales bacterium]MDP7086777.1 S9 family peptidase [Phycisphaerales bacterium]MDP7188476.1 S9 family peptidase [Phycisphaerales bacterium]